MERFHCGHCNEKISKTLYFQHKKIYYNPSTQVWKKSTTVPSGSNADVEEFTFSESEMEMSVDGR